jgi:catechol 2,3-dioxygenase-like lactoylglutathione lyase family enzyme
MEEEAFIRGVSHVSLSVSDLHRSLAFYQDVLKLPILAKPFAGVNFDGEEAMLRVGQTALVLQCHRDHGGGAFDPRRTGLDHLALHVASREALEEWEVLLDESACSHSGIVDIAGWGWMIEFRDPDGIQLELFALSR